MRTIIWQLIRKDLTIMKIPTMLWWLCGLFAVFVIALGGKEMLNFAAILFVSGMVGAGIHAAFRTVVEERREQTLPFIMSLPVTIGQYNTAKLMANLMIFSFVWSTLSVVAYFLVINGETLPAGSIPFLAIILIAIFLAYMVILATSLITEAVGGSIAAMIGANIGAQLMLWWVVSLEGIGSTVKGPVAVWNGTALTVLAVEIAAIVILIVVTYLLQARKREFI